jgi:hypothetical protein
VKHQEVSVDIKIVYIKLGQITSDELWHGSFEDAKEVAQSAVETGNAERVKLLDNQGGELFHYP